MNNIIRKSCLLIFSVPMHLQAESIKPNVLIFIADDWGWEESGAYGNDRVRTPNIDKLANEGMRFDNFFLTASSSSPSRSSIFTGMYPSCTEAHNLHTDLKSYVNLFSDRLQDVGYHTMLVGKSHATNNKKIIAKFDYKKLIDWSKPWTMIDLWKEALMQRPKDKPFFMFAASIDPHRPFKQGVYPNPHNPDSVIVPPYLHDSPQMREELADYYDEISRFDSHVGQTIELLKNQGVLDNTLIMIMTDNGRAFPQCKTRVNVQGLKSPLIDYYPKFIKKGSITSSLASAVDIAPTILEAAGMKKSAGMQGVSLMPILRDPDSEVRKYAFGEHNWHIYSAYERVVITKNYAFIKNWMPQYSNPCVAEAMKTDAYKVMLEAYEKGELAKEQQDCFIKNRPSEEFFNISKDIHCIKNIADKRKYKKEIEKHRFALEIWQESIGDFFLGEDKIKKSTADRITGEKLKN